MFDTLVQSQNKTTRYHGNQQNQHRLIVPKSCLPLSLSALSVTSPKSCCVLMNSTVAHTLRKQNAINMAVNRANCKVVNNAVTVGSDHTLYSQLSGQTAITPIRSINRRRGGGFCAIETELFGCAAGIKGWVSEKEATVVQLTGRQVQLHYTHPPPPAN